MSKYPALMSYIASRSAIIERKWDVLHADEAAARAGELADVANDLRQAQADYAAEAKAKGHDGYPYNRAMGEFLGIPLNSNGENTAYYFASGVMAHYALGVAEREVQRLIACGKPLRIVAARAKTDRKPVRFYVFAGSQITLEGNAVVASDGKRRVRLSSNWSVETCLQRVADAMRHGTPYGEPISA